MRTPRKLFIFLLAGSSLILSPNFNASALDANIGNQAQASVLNLETPFAIFQQELLEEAFKSVSAMPLNPHVKNRSRGQESVVMACLELDQPELALDYMGQIENWRRGYCYAELAYYWAERKDVERAERFLARAFEVAEDSEEDWRRDRIRVRVAQTHFLLGHSDEATQLVENIDESEWGKLSQTEAKLNQEKSFEDQIAELDVLLDNVNFDVKKNAIDAYAELYKRYYADITRRALAESRIRSSWDKMPIFLRMDVLIKLADYSLENGDKNKSITLVDEADEFLADSRWAPEYRLQYAAKLIKLRFRAGAVERAKSDADAALERYQSERESIINIWRAGALRPLAEAYNLMGEKEAALRVYRLAVEEGMENPNSRPRAEDLAETCCSMALQGLEPDAELMARLREIRSHLSAPW